MCLLKLIKKNLRPPLNFPEEKNRRAWDQGCGNWALEGPQDSFYPPNPLIKTEKSKGAVKAWVHLQVDPEAGETQQQVEESLWEVMAYGPNYPKWGGEGINDKKDGGRYFVTFSHLQARKVKQAWDVFGKFDFSLLLFTMKNTFKLQMASYKQDLTVPECKYFAGNKRAKRIFMRMEPNDDIVKLFVVEGVDRAQPGRSQADAVYGDQTHKPGLSAVACAHIEVRGRSALAANDGQYFGVAKSHFP